MSLRLKFILGLSIFFLFFLIILTIFFVYEQQKYLRRELRLRGETICKNLAKICEEPLFSNDDLLLNEFVYNVKEESKDIVYALITDRKGKIVAHSDVKKIGKKYESNNSPDVYEFRSPVNVLGKTIGFAYVGISKKIIEEAVYNTIKNSLFIAFVIISMGVLGVYFIISFMTNDIEKLTGVIMRIGEGNLNIKVETKRRDELGKIAEAVNTMAYKLKKAQEELIETERMKKEMEIAREVQEGLLPEKIPEIKGYEIASFYKPAFEVGGDYYDIITLDKSKFGIILGDVSGKGIPAAFVMTMVKSIIQIVAHLYSNSSKETIAKLHTLIKSNIPEDVFITMIYGILDIDKDELIFSKAGHNPFLFYSAQLNKILSVESKGVPVGFPLEEREFKEILEAKKIKLKKGDLIFLYSDGVIELENPKGEEYGIDRLKDFILKNKEKSLKIFTENIKKELFEFMSYKEQKDDITFFIIKKT